VSTFTYEMGVAPLVPSQRIWGETERNGSGCSFRHGVTSWRGPLWHVELSVSSGQSPDTSSSPQRMSLADSPSVSAIMIFRIQVFYIIYVLLYFIIFEILCVRIPLEFACLDWITRFWDFSIIFLKSTASEWWFNFSLAILLRGLLRWLISSTNDF
jgi:hypothetical protein